MRPLRLPWYQRLLLATALGALAAAASHTRVFWPQDENTYDQMVGNWEYQADPRLVIVAIDDRSLQQLGQWPWPRSTHAHLLDQLAAAGVRRTALDLLFSEPDRKDAQQDTELAAAIARNGNVILPVVGATANDEAVPEELLPVPEIASAAAALAHTDIEIDGDGVSRGVYLKAGVGSAHWPALGLALAGDIGPAPGLRAPENRTPSPYQWLRDNYVRVRYAGPPGSFAQVSYIDVLEGRVVPSLLKGRLVIVGLTASGISPRLLTPTSNESWMSGSEYEANVAAMLLGGRAILPLRPLAQTLLTTVLVILSALALSTSTSQRWVIAALIVPVPVLLSMMLLRGCNLWFSPVTTLAGIIALFLVWGLWQTHYWRRQANHDPLTGLANRMRFDGALGQEVATAVRSGKPLTLMLIDVDHFKEYNDSYGHHVGDEMLRRVAEAIANVARRPRDLASRFGGDEFALILPDTPREGALQLAEQLIANARQIRIPAKKGRVAMVTVTVGICTRVPTADDSPSRLYQTADAALYAAKKAGRDRYGIAP